MKEIIEQIKPALDMVFNHLHENPEVSWREYKTTEYLRKFLESRGFQVQLFGDCPGLVVEVGEGSPCVALRADMDALWQEVDGKFQANHSCGHDAHMTMGVGAMLLLQKAGFPKKGKLKFIFQPAEEKGTGALKMIEHGVLDDVDYLYGVHLRPIQEIRDGEASAAIYHGAARFLTGEIIGEDAHGARPHLGQNAIEIGASFIHEIKNIHLDPMVPHTAKMTKFHAGSDSGNIIPGKASFSLDLRAQTNEIITALGEKIETITEYLSKLYGVKISLEMKANVAAAEVDEEAQKYLEMAIVDVLGAGQLREPIVTSGGEDFHFYTLKKPNIKATMLGLGCDLKPGLHHPDMTFNREAIYSGMEILAKAVMATLEKEE
ncbi:MULTISPECIES: M20 peptidase aminoacylase family protein [Cytobacillus]|uniref:Amidohydrolase n=1 Tax=Cytobacillus oceanisediminis TaxID=665099 RepID=A0ABX3CP62_9BACI|nr:MULTISPECIES: M20 peptidase aminoacylase family protein [Cytobacillus]MBY0154187.1 M20 peptidase aminoacylase family protein [Cytobacillus firmus]MBU8732184.1 M20 peptidase aminoacylase family protein [Cytobacillus oceanisediminis]MCM3392824.1 M20 peptidase aminoacylase family protein [Cytobacillus oceanisediminis]MCM3404650.1 M20 peptidase aminoacylase family protein [Cytobacillus oceanisediminis]MCM3531354.1 M20 peptidase aminoacylase family protein [Cytobacillus oceanisediminis]